MDLHWQNIGVLGGTQIAFTLPVWTQTSSPKVLGGLSRNGTLATAGAVTEGAVAAMLLGRKDRRMQMSQREEAKRCNEKND